MVVWRVCSITARKEMEKLSTDWKYAGKWLKIGLKKYVLPGQSKTRVRCMTLEFSLAV